MILKRNLVFMIISVLILAGCGGNSHSDDHLGIPAREIDVKAMQFEFMPSTIIVRQGEKVELHVESIDVTHGFSVPELGISLSLAPGRDEHAIFTADRKGIFSFRCSVPCGSGHSTMKGQIVVE